MPALTKAEKLEILQRQSKIRREAETERINKFNPACYLHVNTFIEKIEEVSAKIAGKRKIGRPRKKREFIPQTP